MRKLKLDLDAIEVESFDTSTAEHLVRGTVHAKSSENGDCGTGDCLGGTQPWCRPSEPASCGCPRTHSPNDTCYSCGFGTCDVTCAPAACTYNTACLPGCTNYNTNCEPSCLAC